MKKLKTICVEIAENLVWSLLCRPKKAWQNCRAKVPRFFCQARSAPSIYQTVLLRNLINFIYDLNNVLIEILEHIN